MRGWVWGIAAIALLAAPEAYAQGMDPLESGRGYHARCVSRGDAVGQMTTCLTFVLGMHEAVRSLSERARVQICFEGEPHETVAVFVEYLKRNPAKLSERTADLYLMAMAEAFPCPRRPRS